MLRLVGIALLLSSCGGESVAYESPKYEVVSETDAFEVREYQPYLVAETVVDGNLGSAGNQGFRILAKYIFGDNQGEKKVAMTAPVSQEKTAGTTIAMTAPVAQEKAGDKYTIRFMMPSDLSRDTVPTPNDTRITIREVPGRTFAVIRYSGTWSAKNYEKHLAELRAGLRAKGFEPEGEPIWARYDPPFMPWFLRRNEILIAFREAAA